MNDGRWCSSCIEREMKTVSAAVAASSCAVFVPLPRTGYRFFFRTRTQIHTPSRYATILLLLSLYSLSYHIYRLSPLLHFSFRTFFVCPVHCRRYFLERSQQVVALLQVHRISRTYQSVRYNTRAVSRSHSATDDRHANRIQYSNSHLPRHFNKRTRRCIAHRYCPRQHFCL